MTTVAVVALCLGGAVGLTPRPRGVDHRPALGSRIGPRDRGAVQLLASRSAEAAPWWGEPWRVHDFANLAALPFAIALTAAALANARHSTLLVKFFLGYIAADLLWLLLQPSIVRAPAMLVFHHVVTVVLLMHVLLHAPHARYAAWMTIVECNTFLLVLRRHVKRAWIDALFKASWLAIRCCWFPYVPFYFWYRIPEPWPAGPRGRIARAVVTACAAILAAVQLVWTRQALAGREPRPDQAGSAHGSGFLGSS